MNNTCITVYIPILTHTLTNEGPIPFKGVCCQGNLWWN